MRTPQLPTISQGDTNTKFRFLLWVLPVLSSTLIVVTYSDLPEKLPLYYSLPWGVSQLASKVELFLLPAIMVLINLVNSFVYLVFKKQIDGYLITVLLLSGVICNILAGYTILQIIRIIL